MADRDDVLLDLSAWPGATAGTQPRGTTLPPRPPSRGGPRLPMTLPPATRLLAGAVALGAALLLLPLPGSGCGSPLAVWADSPQPAPEGTGPTLDDAQVETDAEAVRRAQLALAAAPPAGAGVARPSPVPVASTVVRPGSADAAARVPVLEREVAQDERDVAAAKAARDEVVEDQQAAGDPNDYDAEVAAAQEDLDAAEARLAEDRQALAAARRAARSTTTTVVVASPAPVRPAPSAPAAAPARAEAVAALAAAQRAQATHLAQRRTALAAWTEEHDAALARVESANAGLRACEGRTRGPGLLGALGVLGAGAALVRRRLSLRG